VRPFKQALVDILVSKDQLEHALQVANALFWTLERKGHSVVHLPSGRDCHRIAPRLKEDGTEQTDYYSSRFGRWRPSNLTVCLVGDLSFGLTIFETSEEVEVRYDSATHDYVRVRAPDATTKKKFVSQAAGYDGWTTKRWLPTGRLGIHLYCPQVGIDWERYWREKRRNELPSLFHAIILEMESAPPFIATLVEKRRQEDERHRIEWEEQKRKWEEQEAKRRHQELEQAREKALLEAIKAWRLARDVRRYVGEIKSLVADAGMRLTQDGTPDHELNWALAYADRVDPLSAWRAEIEEVKIAAEQEVYSSCERAHDEQTSTGEASKATDTTNGSGSAKDDSEST
jgi:hypothetical protein